MLFKSFKNFINEDYHTSLQRKGLIVDLYDDEYEVNYYMEKLAEPFDINNYMKTFMTFKNTVYRFLTDPHFRKPAYLRFFLVYYNNYFTMYIFNSYIRHNIFVKLLDRVSASLAVKPISSNVYTTLYNNSYKREFYKEGDIEKEKQILDQLKYLWCLPGLYDGGKIQTLASQEYLKLLARLDCPKKLGFSDEEWKATQNI